MIKRAVLGLSIIFLLAVCMLIQSPRADAVENANATAEELLPAFLSEVIGLDLTQYNRTRQGYGVSYPSELGGVVKRESASFTLEHNDGKISVSCHVENGCITYLHVNNINSSLFFTTQTTIDSLAESRNIFQRYQVFAQRYGINAVNVTAALDLLGSVPPEEPQAYRNVENFNEMSDLTPTNATSGDMKLKATKASIGFWYTINGVDVKNKYFGINFDWGTFVFWDSWNLYSIGGFSVLSEEEAASWAFEVANAYVLNRTWYQTDENDVKTEVKPEWSQRQDIGCNMIKGQTYNNSLNQALLAAGTGVSLGNTTREPLALYPFWSTIFFFTEPIGHIAGIQVGLWGDTKEIAYCMEYGFLGGTNEPAASSTSDTEQSPTPTPTHQSTATPEPEREPSPAVSAAIAAASAALAVTVAVGLLVYRKKHKKNTQARSISCFRQRGIEKIAIEHSRLTCSGKSLKAASAGFLPC